MPSGKHESAVAAFAAFPQATAALVERMFSIDLPPHDGAHRGPTAFQKLVPTTYHADNTLVFTKAGRRVFAVVIEVQRRWTPDKWPIWKIYAANLEKELGVRVILVVFCPGAGDAEKYRGLTGPDTFSLRLRPCVLSPDEMPLVEDATKAKANMPMAALSLVCHTDDDPATLDTAFGALFAAMHEIDQDLVRDILDMLAIGLSATSHSRWDKHMSMVDSRFRSELLRNLDLKEQAKSREEGRIEGRAEGRADAVLSVLTARSVEVPEPIRERILACTDLDMIDTWLRRALTADSADDVIA